MCSKRLFLTVSCVLSAHIENGQQLMFKGGHIDNGHDHQFCIPFHWLWIGALDVLLCVQMLCESVKGH